MHIHQRNYYPTSFYYMFKLKHLDFRWNSFLKKEIYMENNSSPPKSFLVTCAEKGDS